MICICPTCNRPMEGARAPIEALASAPLSRQQREMLNGLIRVYPRALDRDQIFDSLYQLDPNGGPDDIQNCISVRMYYIRKVIERFGWTIPKQTGGNGVRGRYRLAPLEGAG